MLLQCYYCQSIIVTKVVQKIDVKEFKIECENELDCLRRLKSNLIMTKQCQKVSFRFSCTESGSYINMFMLLLDFVIPLNIFFLEITVFWYIIIQLSLSGSSYII